MLPPHDAQVPKKLPRFSVTCPHTLVFQNFFSFPIVLTCTCGWWCVKQVAKMLEDPDEFMEDPKVLAAMNGEAFEEWTGPVIEGE